MRIPDSMKRKMDPKVRKTIFIGYDRYIDKVYRVFDLEKKIVERVADVTIEDVTSTMDQVLFPLPFEEQEEEFEKSNDEELQVDDYTTSKDSHDNFVNAIENLIESMPRKKRG